eukprot:3264711-Amphidinium_carterae.1
MPKHGKNKKWEATVFEENSVHPLYVLFFFPKGISEEIVATSLRRIVSDQVPTILMDSSRIGGAKFLRIAQQLTESSLFKDFSTRQSSNEARHVTSNGTPQRATSSLAVRASSIPAKQMRAET